MAGLALTGLMKLFEHDNKYSDKLVHPIRYTLPRKHREDSDRPRRSSRDNDYRESRRESDSHSDRRRSSRQYEPRRRSIHDHHHDNPPLRSRSRDYDRDAAYRHDRRRDSDRARDRERDRDWSHTDHRDTRRRAGSMDAYRHGSDGGRSGRHRGSWDEGEPREKYSPLRQGDSQYDGPPPRSDTRRSDMARGEPLSDITRRKPHGTW